MHPDHLAYFKDLLEGRADISWNAWFKRNQQSLSAQLNRADFLRLKFNKLDEAERLLQQAAIPYVLSPLAKRERHHAMLHESVLDEHGRPLLSFRRKAYDGALGQLMDGDVAQAEATLAAYLGKLRRQPQGPRAEAVADLCFDGEMELVYGTQAIGITMLQTVAAIAEGDDLLDPSIQRAQHLLASRPLPRQRTGQS